MKWKTIQDYIFCVYSINITVRYNSAVRGKKTYHWTFDSGAKSSDKNGSK